MYEKKLACVSAVERKTERMKGRVLVCVSKSSREGEGERERDREGEGERERDREGEGEREND